MLNSLIVPLEQAEKIDPKIFPKPNYSHISKKIKVGDPIWIDFDNMYIDDEGNIARDHDGGFSSHINDLISSFSSGVRTNEELGAVIDRGNEYNKRYELKYSYHRTDALQQLGRPGHWYYPITADESEWLDICSVENEPKPPKLANKEQEIVAIQAKQIEIGNLKNDEDSIKIRLKQIYPTRPKKSIERIAQGIFQIKKTDVRFQYWTNPKIKRWRNENYEGHFEIDGTYDEKRKMYGFTSKIGGLYRTFHRARVKYAETGYKSYVSCYTGQITPKENLKDQRDSIIDEYVSLRLADYKTYGIDICFVELNGFFPQDKQEGKQKFILPNIQSSVEKTIKTKIDEYNKSKSKNAA